MKRIKKLLILLSICILIIPQTGCKTTEPVSEEFFCLDTICTITVYGMSRDEGEKIVKEAVDTCIRYEKLLSKNIEESDVYKINTAGGKPVAVSDDTLELILKGIEFGKLSDGKFDITIGAVSSLWDFKSEAPVIPDDDDIHDALKTVDYRQVKVDGNKVSLEKEGAQLDLGGIAKGYIADRISKQLIDAGAENAIINLGGNVVAVGEKEDGSAWVVGIERPYSDRSEIIGSIEICNETVTTSGIYERSFEYDGKLYHHVLDPYTGYPAATDFEAVTVEGPIGMSAESDAFGTIFLMLGPRGTEKILKNYPEFKAVFIDSKDEMTKLNGMKIRTLD